MKRLLAYLIVLVVGFAAGYYFHRSQVECVPFCMRTIHVAVSGDTAPFSVVPDPVHASRGDVLKWSHPTADTLIIDFTAEPRGAPTDKSVLMAARGDTASAAVRRDAALGPYKYAVIVASGGQRDTLDPQVIVEEIEGRE
jgi:hypothetical protein